MVHWCKIAFVKSVITLTPHDGVDCDVTYTLIEKAVPNIRSLSIIWCENGDVLRLYPSLSQKNGDPHLLEEWLSVLQQNVFSMNEQINKYILNKKSVF